MTIKRRLKSKSGFTLAETLLAVLILMLVSLIVANGMPTVRNVYNNVIVGANAQMLLSTSVTALRNELGTARDIVVKNGTTVSYFNGNPNRQAYSKISLATSAPNKIVVDPYINSLDKTTPLSGSKQRDLVSYAASNKDLYITYEKVEYDGTNDSDIIVFKNLEVKRINDSSSTLASLSELKIRLIPVSASVV
ncbi:MAG: type II secretion system protein [Oscillospiraceae bacterium]|nr:type II secretion system protein [Clostridia bacterium]MBQ9249228.1 type II secretion system protein [Oscillospiraceae bacterium]MBR1643877.1 type II secretion system protein [Bacteroidales bacterium]